MVERWENSFKREAGLFYKGTNHTYEGSTSWSNHFPEWSVIHDLTHFQIPPHWWLIFQHWYCGGRHKQSVLCKFEVISLCSFDLHFFLFLSVICVSSLEIRPFKPFEIQLFACCCWDVRVFVVVVVLDINPLSDIWFANIFFHFVV